MPRERLEGEAQQLRVAVVGGDGLDYPEKMYFLRAERDPPEVLRAATDQAEHPSAGAGVTDCFNLHRLAEQRAEQELSFADRRTIRHR